MSTPEKSHFESTTSVDPEAAKPYQPPSRITFELDDRLGRQGHASGSRSRSASRNSISNIRRHSQSGAGIPIEFRTLSFEVAHSQSKQDIKTQGLKGWREKKVKDGKGPKQEDQDYFANLEFHLLGVDAVCDQLDVSLSTGLRAPEVAARLLRDGKNALPRHRENYLKKLLVYLFGGFCSILWVGVIIFFICWRPLGDPNPAPYNLGLAILVIIAILLQACFSAFQDWSTARTMNAILNLLPTEARVIREGEASKVPSTDLVAGDIVKITTGDKVPADLRLLHTSGDVRFDRAMLTCESEEIDDAIDKTDNNYLESRNIALMGTMVTNRSATGLVVLTGGNTVMGRIAKATNPVNNAPALRLADVGIAMCNGSDVAIEAADLVLLDRFDSIIEAICLGRLVFQNLQKVISYLLSAGSWSKIWPVLLNVFFGVPLPLSSFLIIIICVFTDLFLSLSLIMEKEEFDLLSLPLRNHKKEHLINLKIYAQSYLVIGVMETVCAHSTFFFYMYRYAGIPFHALVFAFEKYSASFYRYTKDELTYFNTVGQSVYFVTLVILQWGNILSIRNKRLSIVQAYPIRKARRNPWLLAGAGMSLAIAIFVTEVPGIMNEFSLSLCRIGLVSLLLLLRR